LLGGLVILNITNFATCALLALAWMCALRRNEKAWIGL
jgi:hypothetical protein